MRILLIEDDDLIVEPLVEALTDQHYVVDVATDGQAGLELGSAFTYDLLLLDVMLPNLDGITLCRRLRSEGNRLPILMLTVRHSSTDKVIGLDAGADDYLVKPFDLQELLARVRALLRRGSLTTPPVLEWRNLRLDPSICEVTHNGQLLHLTPKEYALLELFLRNRQRIFSQGAILEHLWSFEEPQEDTVRAHIKGLRQKLRAVGAPADLIETVYGLGYRLRLPASSETRSPSTDLCSPASKLGPTKAQLENHSPQTVLDMVGGWQRFQARFSNRVTVLEQAAASLLQGKLGGELRQKAEQAAHKLAGSLGMFGLAEGSRLAQQIEQMLQAKTALGRDQVLSLSKLVAVLRRELEQSRELEQMRVGPVIKPQVDQRPLLLVVDDDSALTEQLVAEAGAWGVRVQVATDLAKARQVIYCDRPQVVLLTLCLADSVEQVLTLLAELSSCTPPIPVLVLTGQDHLINRVKVARLGGRGFFPKPIVMTRLLEAVTQLLQRGSDQPKVMVVDDDPAVLLLLRNLVQPWGIHLTTLDNPQQFWEVLKASVPDLLILDVEMPYLSGIELCQVVRNDPQWSQLPILFLSAHTDRHTLKRVFAAGADDYVSKPIAGPELVARIFNRLERSQLLEHLAEIDPLTRLANRHKLTADLQDFLRTCNQEGQTLCLAVLSLDNLQQINDQYNHDIGDRVLGWLGAILKQAFRGEDVVGRWAGAEFGVGMVGMNRAEGTERLAEVLQTLREQEFPGPKGSFQVTFSAGVAQYPQDGQELPALYQAAKSALVKATAERRQLKPAARQRKTR